MSARYAAIASVLVLIFALFPASASKAWQGFPAPRLNVSLDDPPSERWIPVLEALAERHGTWGYTGKAVFDYLNQFATPDEWHKYNETLSLIGRHLLGEEIYEETRSLVTFANQPKYAANVTVGAACFFQIFYEIAMECTGILAHAAEGGMVHGRNMDMGLPTTNVTAQVTWLKGGKEILTSTQFVGYAGIHSGMRHNGWSAQLNERVVLTPGPFIGWRKAIVLEIAARLALGGTPCGIFLRDALLKAATFDEALPILETTKLASPMYVIVGGANAGDGAVIIRDPEGVATHSQFNLEKPKDGKSVWTFAGTQDRWHVQTNWDEWFQTTHSECAAKMAELPSWEESLCEKFIHAVYDDNNKCDEFCQLYSDGRREAGKEWMARFMGAPDQNATAAISRDDLYTVMTTSPVHVSGTRFTTIMSASTNYYNTTVWGFGGNNEAVTTSSSSEGEGIVYNSENKGTQLVEMGKVLLEALLKLDVKTLPKRA